MLKENGALADKESTQAPIEGQPGPGVISYSQVIDLSWAITPDIPRWPGDPPVETEVVARIERDGYFLRRFSMGEHSGTHLTAPASFFARGPDTAAYPAERLVVPATVIAVTAHCENDPDYSLTLGELAGWEREHGAVASGSLVILRTGWSRRWQDPASYLGSGPDGRLHFPGFGVDAARILVEQRQATGLATDTAGVDPGTDREFLVSRLALAESRIVLENLTNLEQLPPTGATLVIGLLRLAGSSGAPASVTAFIP